MTNVIVANLAKSRFFRCPPLYQYNYGMVLRIMGIDLPDAYQVDFANDINGSSITQVGNADGVSIPSQFFTPGQAIYAWLRVHPTADSGVTTATIVIPISPRATITDDEPTPEEQSAIDEAIAALNDAVDRADEAVVHYPTITGGIWYVWDVDAGEYVSTGISAQGAQGNPGVDGQDGTDGFSPVATVTQTASGATISITDKQGTTTANISNGQNGSPGQPGTDGTDGVSPTVTVTDITGGHRITITDATGAHSFDVMDGESGAGAVQDVQVNGASVVTDGVANVPIASDTTLGVMRIAKTGGLRLDLTNNLQVSYAANVEIKAGVDSFSPITPAYQQRSAFYGLAKAAGSDEKNSTLPVGQYTDAAKYAIQSMLGIYSWQYVGQYVQTEAAQSMGLITLPRGVQEVRLFINIKAAASTMSMRLRVKNVSNDMLLNNTFSSRITTSDKTTLFELTTMPGGMWYALIDGNGGQRRDVYQDYTATDILMRSVEIISYASEVFIPTGSSVNVWIR